jgi:hypothetical protein
MTTTELLAAAATALRTDTTPLHAALADWLDDTHRDMTERIHAWERAYDPDHARELMEKNAGLLYAHPLAVAWTVLDGAT